MKKILKTTCIAITLGLLATQTSFAGTELSFSKNGVKGNDYIHRTNVHLADPSKETWVDGFLSIGEKNCCGKCVTNESIAEVHGFVVDGWSISAASELFAGKPLSEKTCAVEEFNVLGGKVARIEYTLVNDGETVIAANPDSHDVTFDNTKKK